MKIVMFYHSLISDWNHGNAHFLRGITTELQKAGHEPEVYEPQNGWSLENLKKEHGEKAVVNFQKMFPHLKTNFYNPDKINWDKILSGVDLVIVHEWNDKRLVNQLGELKRKYNYCLLFHDTHHRSLTDPKSMAEYDLREYDGVLAYGKVIRDIYLKKGGVKKAWIWHEAADTNVFKPIETIKKQGDLVWIGNWGDDERTQELHEFLIEPVKELKLKATIYGVRYPDTAIKALKDAGITYGGWLANHLAPEVFSKYKLTVHVPRRPYVQALPGIPTIRPFEALACKIPLISAPWNDAEHLFEEDDFIMVNDGNEMKNAMHRLLEDPFAARELQENGYETIHAKHTCTIRVNELLTICEELGLAVDIGDQSVAN